MHKSTRRFLPILALLTCIAAPLRAEITIAAVGPMTGQDATLGEQLRRGVEAAAAAINESGGILGEKVRVLYKDDACDPKQGVAIANQLAGEHVVGVIGTMCSGTSIPMAKILAEENIVMISPSATSPALTESGEPNIFRVCGRDDQQGAILGHYVAKHFPGRNVAIIHDKTAFGSGLAQEMRKALNADGVKETIYDSINRGERDYSALISKFKQARIGVLLYGGYHPEAGLIVRQMNDRKLNVPLVSGDGLTTAEFWSITGESGAGTLMAYAPDPRKNPEAQQAVERIRKTGFEPEGYTLQSYAAFEVLSQAMARAGAADGAKIAETIRAGSFPTVIGNLSFDAKGDLRQPQFAIYRWANGTYKELEEK